MQYQVFFFILVHHSCSKEKHKSKEGTNYGQPLCIMRLQKEVISKQAVKKCAAPLNLREKDVKSKVVAKKWL